MFPLPRVIFAMARDGLLFSFLARISERKAPVNSTVAAGVMSGKMKRKTGTGIKENMHVYGEGDHDAKKAKSVTVQPVCCVYLSNS